MTDILQNALTEIISVSGSQLHFYNWILFLYLQQKKRHEIPGKLTSTLNRIHAIGTFFSDFLSPTIKFCKIKLQFKMYDESRFWRNWNLPVLNLHIGGKFSYHRHHHNKSDQQRRVSMFGYEMNRRRLPVFFFFV